MDETPVGPESTSGDGAPARNRNRPRLRLDRVLKIDFVCFAVAWGLLLFHLMVSPSGVLAIAAVTLLAMTGASAVHEHVVLARGGFTEPARSKKGESSQHPSHNRILLGLLACILVPALAVNALGGAAIGALLAWGAGWDVSRAAWLGFFMTLIWCGVTLAYAVVRVAFFILHARWRFAAAGAGSQD